MVRVSNIVIRYRSDEIPIFKFQIQDFALFIFTAAVERYADRF